MGSGGGEVRITLTAEHAKVGVAWMGTIKGKKGGAVLKSLSGMAVDEVGDGVKGLNPVLCGNGLTGILS